MREPSGRHHFQAPPKAEPDPTYYMPRPVMPSPPPKPPIGRWFSGGMLVGAVLGMLVGCSVGVIGATRDNGQASTAAMVTPSAARRITPIPVPSPTPTPKAKISKSDLKLTVVESRRKCFGSAGCNVGYTVEATLVRPNGWDLDASYQISYRVRAGSREIIKDTFTLAGKRYSIPDDFTMSVPEDVKLTASVISVKKVSA